MLQHLLKPKQKEAKIGSVDTFNIPKIDQTLEKMEAKIKEDSRIEKAAKAVRKAVERSCGC